MKHSDGTFSIAKRNLLSRYLNFSYVKCKLHSKDFLVLRCRLSLSDNVLESFFFFVSDEFEVEARAVLVHSKESEQFFSLLTFGNSRNI
jgi:hypothetical protein